jgi:Protein of unknown function with HXXEE motif
MHVKASDARDDRGPFGLYDRWPFVHLVIGAALVAVAAYTWPWATDHPRWMWFLFLTVPVLIVHQFEESAFPGGFRRWFNRYVCFSPDDDRPLSKKQMAFNHMPLMVLYPTVAFVGSRWPWFGLAGIYALVADGFFHLSGTGITRRYSPGAATGLLLYIPLGVFATWYLVAGRDVTAFGLLAAVLLGAIGLNGFMFLLAAKSTDRRPRLRPDGLTASEVGGLPGTSRLSVANAQVATSPATTARDARTEQTDILPTTRRLAAVIIPILAFAFIVLYITPGNNGAHFSYDVQPRMSAMLLGATYLTGVVYFSTILWARSWHQVRLGLLPVALFATMLGIATVLHWGEFNHGAPEFLLWRILYFGLPLVLPVVWLLNERHARPMRPVADDFRLGRTTRAVLMALGVSIGLTSLFLFLAPGTMAKIWPWELTGLNARVIAAEFGLFSLFGLHLAAEAKWSQVRDLIRPQLLTPLLYLGAIVASWSDFDHASPVTFAFVAFVVVAFVFGFPALYFPGEARLRRQIRATAKEIDRP